MAVPTYQQMLLPFLKLLGDKREHSLIETIEHICQEFRLTDDEKKVRKATGGLLVNNRVAWARTYLGKAGLLEGTRRGHFKITDRGAKVLQENPPELNDRFLMRYPEFTSFLKSPKKQENVDKFVKGTLVSVAKIPKHNELRDMLLEIGKIEGRVAGVEYPLENWRLDVVWKTIPTGNPKWAFEVQLGGNFYEALTKLKHAWDKWNSRPFLVTTEGYAAQAKLLLEGSFHEMREDARIIDWQRIVDLHKCLKQAHQIKSEIKL